MSTINIFRSYEQRENHFTNGLFALLSLSIYDDPQFVANFLKDLLYIEPKERIDSFRVLKDMPGTEDAELSGGDCCIRFETKIESGTLREDQLRCHLNNLKNCSKSIKKLVLLTSDDGNSQYIDQFLSIDRAVVQHLAWIQVYNHLDMCISKRGESLFSQLVRQFLDIIREKVFEQDYAGIIAKIDFGKKSGIYPNKYLQDIKSGLKSDWKTPSQYKKLDGTGRKLMLYDKEQKGITVEAEIAKVERTDSNDDYPWTNSFAKVVVFDTPITLDRIEALTGLEHFGKGRSPYRNITQEQYRKLRLLPLDWQEGQRLCVEKVDDDKTLVEEIDRDFDLLADLCEASEPAEEEQLERALQEARRLAKEQVRRHMELA